MCEISCRIGTTSWRRGKASCRMSIKCTSDRAVSRSYLQCSCYHFVGSGMGDSTIALCQPFCFGPPRGEATGFLRRNAPRTKVQGACPEETVYGDPVCKRWDQSDRCSSKQSSSHPRQVPCRIPRQPTKADIGFGVLKVGLARLAMGS